MVEVVTFQDQILQWLKKAERAFYVRAYGALERERLAFEKAGRAYTEYPRLSDTSSILIYKPDDIGDAVYALPALLDVKRRFPKAKLYLLCQDKTKPFYERTQIFDQVVAVPVKTRWLRFQSFDLEKALDQFPIEKFDLAVFLRTYPAYYRQFKKIPAEARVVPADPRLRTESAFTAFVTPHVHQSKQMLEIVERIYERPKGELPVPQFHWLDSDQGALHKVFGEKVPDRYLVIHPYARFETRRYPYEYWRDILFEVKEKLKIPLVIVGGREDLPLGMEGTIEVQGKLGLTETGYLISKSAGFIGNESGPAHWASLLEIPTVMIMSGHSHLSEWGPLGNSLVLRKSVPCENCYLRACPKYKVRCLTEMPPSDLTPQILKFFKK